MPIYEFFCEKCGKKQEVIAKMSEKVDPICDNCQIKMKLQVNSLNFILKGSGWSQDGYE